MSIPTFVRVRPNTENFPDADVDFVDAVAPHVAGLDEIDGRIREAAGE